jgi:hypothetical protein
MAAAQADGLEGVVAKRLTSTYQPGRRSHDWVNVPLSRTQEVVVIGYNPAVAAAPAPSARSRSPSPTPPTRSPTPAASALLCQRLKCRKPGRVAVVAGSSRPR